MSPNKYAIAVSLRYKVKRKPRPNAYHTTLTGRLGFVYTDKWVTQLFEFDGMDQFIEFLVERPPLAKAVGFIAKKSIDQCVDEINTDN